ncbi:MAG: hypothetical protein JNK05_14980 [Myxococcales bacterium]|nr:hypothetical protein [Myxococcales bacterium]
MHQTELASFDERRVELCAQDELVSGAALCGSRDPRCVALVCDSDTARIVVGAIEEPVREVFRRTLPPESIRQLRAESSADGSLLSVIASGMTIAAFDNDGAPWPYVEQLNRWADNRRFVLLDRNRAARVNGEYLELVDFELVSSLYVPLGEALDEADLDASGSRWLIVRGIGRRQRQTLVFDARTLAIESWSETVREGELEWVGDEVAVSFDHGEARVLDRNTRATVRAFAPAVIGPLVAATRDRIAYWDCSSVRWVALEASDDTIYGPDFAAVRQLSVADSGTVVAQHIDGCVRAWAGDELAATKETDTVDRTAPELLGCCDGGATALLFAQAVDGNGTGRLHAWGTRDGQFDERWSVAVPWCDPHSACWSHDAGVLAFVVYGKRLILIDRRTVPVAVTTTDVGFNLSDRAALRVFDDRSIEYCQSDGLWIRWRFEGGTLVEERRAALRRGGSSTEDARPAHELFDFAGRTYGWRTLAFDAGLSATIGSWCDRVIVADLFGENPDEDVECVEVDPIATFTAASLSPSGQWLAVGTSRGTIALFRRGARPE